MAIGKLKTDISDLFKPGGKAYETAALEVGTRKIHTLEVDTETMARLSMDATMEALIRASKTSKPRQVIADLNKEYKGKIFKKETWVAITDNVLKNFNPAHVSSVKPKGKGYLITIKEGSSNAETNYIRISKILRRKIFKKWSDKYPKVKVKTGSSTGYPAQKVKKQNIGSRVTHTDQSVYEGYFKIKAEDTLSAFTGNTTSFNLIDTLMSNLQVSVREETKFKKAKISQKREISLKMTKSDIPLPLDRGKEDQVKEIFLKSIEKTLKDSNSYFGENSEKALEAEASKPFKQQATQVMAHNLAKALIKNKRVKSKKIPKNLKSHKRSAVIKKATKARKPIKKKISLPARIKAAKIIASKEKGKGEKSTSNISSLVKLKRYINSRLGAEVRRNMGRPALINRTGRFSNSVNLMSLTEGNSTIVAKYTYLLNPYATFENMGKRRWPLAYNPKPLIAKSIRNLAQGRIEDKLTLRRV